ncbi:hypothetical protein DFH08DRAFT_800097 [Mycena albidolilacea]|uniref:Uncharacterized protein n=1 Tax=Mycena albidolilacea TaxID=1033008 RepID=A0AAD7EZN8_9AGAR|nr:hypothetical protein DFH08DRAFT_800097 [Mycena albidolilacea]
MCENFLGGGTRQECVFPHLPLPLSKECFYTAPNASAYTTRKFACLPASTVPRKNTPPLTAHSSSLSPGGGSHAYTGSLLAPSVSPTKSTATAKSAKSVGVKSGRRFAFWTRGKGTPPESPTKQGGKGAGGEESELNLRSFRHVSPAATNANANSRLAGSTSYTNLNSSQTNLVGGSTAKLTASNLSSLEMDLGGAPRRPRPRGGSDASASSGGRISVAAFREVHAQRQGQGRVPSPGPGPGMYVGSGAGSQQNLHAQQQQRSQPRQGREREQQTPTKGSPPPAKTTLGKHYQAPAHFNSLNPQQQGQPRKTSGHTRQPQVQWDSETSQSLVGWWARAWWVEEGGEW